MKILLIGGTGFLGSSVSEKLKSLGHFVRTTGFTRKGDFHLDLLDLRQLNKVFSIEDWEVVINFAGVLKRDFSNLALSEFWYRVNMEGPFNVAEVASEVLSAPLLIHIASATEPGLTSPIPESKYSETKHLGRLKFIESVERNRLSAEIAVVHNVYGVDQDKSRFLPWVIDNLRRNQPISIRFPDRVRDFCIRVEVAEVIAEIADERRLNQDAGSLRTREIGTGVGISLREAALAIALNLGADFKLVSSDLSLNLDVHPEITAKFDASRTTMCKMQFSDGIARVIAGFE